MQQMRPEVARPPSEGPLDRFLRYAAIDTQSAEGQATVPSTMKQLDHLAKLLVEELQQLGAENLRLSESGIVYAMVPGNLGDTSTVPVIGFIAHLDTSPAVSGEHVNVLIHRGYQGGDITLRRSHPGDPRRRQSRARRADRRRHHHRRRHDYSDPTTRRG